MSDDVGCHHTDSLCFRPRSPAESKVARSLYSIGNAQGKPRNCVLEGVMCSGKGRPWWAKFASIYPTYPSINLGIGDKFLNSSL